MRNFLIVLKYTILENARKKVFIITNVILVLLTLLVFNIPNIINAFSKDNTSGNQTIAVIDESNIYQNVLDNYKLPEMNYSFKMESSTKIEELKKDVDNNKIASLIVLESKDNALTYDYIVDNERTALSADIITSILKAVNMNLTLSSLNLDQATLSKMNMPITYEMISISKDEISPSSYILSILASLVLYLTIYFYGYSVSQSVSNEKTSRVMETLITSAKPSSIVLGKTVAMGVLGLAQMLLLIITTAISYKLFISGDIVIFGEKLDFSSITLPFLLIIILYFILGYCLFATLNAVTGATVSKAEDIQSASMPVTMISLLSFYLGYFSLMDSTSSITSFASIFPFSAPFTMPSRMMTVAVPTEEIVASILLLIGVIMLLAWLSIRLYSVAILQYGQKMNIMSLFKAYKDR